ncbi:hypothetical protein JOC77_001668 [Peribacillus deserti]|uniref:Swarming motility protein SwrB n=1 Tax=Peribacillus deserti TaxID=673318 RepID=A0ABS2QGF3_9BACI|nr:hypothetical protein [Peribacillus deserti]MBM7692238.1 hypothetical protein [Peribacillus deserti]
MTAFLLVLSFILNIIALLGIIILYSRQNRMLQFEKNQKEAVKELETILSSFAAEMKEDHESLLAKLTPFKHENFAESKLKTPKKLSSAVTPKDSRAENSNSHPSSLQTPKRVKNKKALSAYKGSGQKAELDAAESLLDQFPDDVVELTGRPTPAAETEKSFKEHFNRNIDAQSDNEQIYINSLLQQALELKKLGLSHDQIAKKLQKGKTEIDLLLKIRS